MTNPVRLTSITYGADFEIDLTAFAEAEPKFAYVDDLGDGVMVLHGLETDGNLTLLHRPQYMWLQGPRECVLLKVTAEGRRDRRAAFRSLGIGEFCLEIYHVQPNGEVVLLHADDFCFK